MFSSMKATDRGCADYQSLMKIIELKHEEVDIHLNISDK